MITGMTPWDIPAPFIQSSMSCSHTVPAGVHVPNAHAAMLPCMTHMPCWGYGMEHIVRDGGGHKSIDCLCEGQVQNGATAKADDLC